MRLAILADTHLPRGARRLPDRCVEEIEAADLVLHAGDFTTVAFYAELRSLNSALVAVHGNVDEVALQRTLPEAVEVPVDGLTLGMVHIAGAAQRRLQRLQARFPACHAVVFGHSHIPLHETGADGFQIFNPGSPTDRRAQPRHTMGVATVEDQRIAFAHIALD